MAFVGTENITILPIDYDFPPENINKIEISNLNEFNDALNLQYGEKWSYKKNPFILN